MNDKRNLLSGQKSGYCGGPKTLKGKSKSSKNATRHGILSSQLLLEDEDACEFNNLVIDLTDTLRPSGALERTLLDRIAVTMWRQARLVRAETASLELARRDEVIAEVVSSELDVVPVFFPDVDGIKEFDKDLIAWCESVVAELAGNTFDIPDTLECAAPNSYQQLCDDAEQAGVNVDTFLENAEGGMRSYLAELAGWCRRQLREAAKRPERIAVAQRMMDQRLMPSEDLCNLFARYQTTLDNQLYKALRAFKEMQEWRLGTLEAVSNG